MITHPNINYTSTHFEYPAITEIHEFSTYDLLRKMKNEMKANGASFPCNLGGGAHTHLGLILTALEHANISRIAYIRLLHQGILNIPTGMTNFESKRLANEYK